MIHAHRTNFTQSEGSNLSYEWRKIYISLLAWNRQSFSDLEVIQIRGPFIRSNYPRSLAWEQGLIILASMRDRLGRNK